MSDLFSATTEQPPVEPLVFENFYELAARQKLGKPQEWVLYAFESIGPDILVTGLIPVSHRKDRRPVFKGKGERVMLTHTEVDAAERQHEAETGKCAKCSGHGREFKGWRHIDGYSYRECRSCHGTGKP